MMTRHEADDQLRKAIIDHAEAYGISEDGELLCEYAVIASWQATVDQGRTQYTTHFHQPTVPSHIASGLFGMGEALAMEGISRHGDDDWEDL